MSGFDRIPDELLDGILSLLSFPPREAYSEERRCFEPSPNKDGLSAASLVSHRWRACTLPYLFREVVFHHYPDPLSNSPEVLRGVEDVLDEMKTIPRLLEFLDTHPLVCPYVQQLSLRLATSWPGRLKKYADVLEWNTTAHIVVASDLLMSIISGLPSLRALTLIDLEFTVPSTSKGVDIDTLYLGLSSRSVDVAQTLACFSNIGCLHIVLPLGRHIIGSSDIPDELAHRLSVRSLFIHDSVTIQPFSDLFSRSRTFLSLTKLFISPVILPHMSREMRNFLVAFSGHIADLTCRLSTMERVGTFIPSDVYLFLFAGIAWPELVQLTIHFELHFTLSHAWHLDASLSNKLIWGYLSDLLTNFALCPALRSVILAIDSFVMSEDFRVYMEEIAALEQVLIAFPKLEKVTIKTRESRPPLPVVQRELLKRVMPTLQQKGMLYF